MSIDPFGGIPTFYEHLKAVHRDLPKCRELLDQFDEELLKYEFRDAECKEKFRQAVEFELGPTITLRGQRPRAFGH